MLLIQIEWFVWESELHSFWESESLKRGRYGATPTYHKNMRQKQIEAFGIWFTWINHLVHICVIAPFARAGHDQFLHTTLVIQSNPLKNFLVTVLPLLDPGQTIHFCNIAQKKE